MTQPLTALDQGQATAVSTRIASEVFAMMSGAARDVAREVGMKKAGDFDAGPIITGAVAGVVAFMIEGGNQPDHQVVETVRLAAELVIEQVRLQVEFNKSARGMSEGLA